MDLHGHNRNMCCLNIGELNWIKDHRHPSALQESGDDVWPISTSLSAPPNTDEGQTRSHHLAIKRVNDSLSSRFWPFITLLHLIWWRTFWWRTSGSRQSSVGGNPLCDCSPNVYFHGRFWVFHAAFLKWHSPGRLVNNVSDHARTPRSTDAAREATVSPRLGNSLRCSLRSFPAVSDTSLKWSSVSRLGQLGWSSGASWETPSSHEKNLMRIVRTDYSFSFFPPICVRHWHSFVKRRRLVDFTLEAGTGVFLRSTCRTSRKPLLLAAAPARRRSTLCGSLLEGTTVWKQSPRGHPVTLDVLLKRKHVYGKET